MHVNILRSGYNYYVHSCITMQAICINQIELCTTYVAISRNNADVSIWIWQK